MISKINWVFFTLFFAGLIISQPSRAQKTTRIVTENLLSAIGQSEMLGNSYTISNNLRRIGFRIREGNKVVAMIDTIKGNPFDEINMPVFSHDAKRFAYAARNGSNWLVIVDNKQVASLDPGSILIGIYFSPDNKSFVYLVRKGSKSFVVSNGREGASFDNIDENSLRFTDKGNKVVFSAQVGEKHCIVIDGKKGKYHDQVGFPIFSSDGKRYAYWVVDSNRTYLMMNDKKSKPYEAINAMAFSLNGKHFVYQVVNAGSHYIVRDSIEGEKYEALNSVTLSADGSHLAYGITQSPGDKDGFKEYVVIDKKKEGPYEQIMSESFLFSPNGKDVVYAAQLPPPHPDTPLKEGESDGEWFMIHNGKAGKRYEILPGIAVFSSNSLHLAYGCEYNSKRRVNLDGVEKAPFDDLYSIVFSPDSKRLAYSVKLDNKELVVVDENNGRSYDSLLGQGGIIFDSADSFHYIATRGNNIYLVEERFE